MAHHSLARAALGGLFAWFRSTVPYFLECTRTYYTFSATVGYDVRVNGSSLGTGRAGSLFIARDRGLRALMAVGSPFFMMGKGGEERTGRGWPVCRFVTFHSWTIGKKRYDVVYGHKWLLVVRFCFVFLKGVGGGAMVVDWLMLIVAMAMVDCNVCLELWWWMD
ncbi:hypothetical protein L873DRAFT_1292028 [Choiromyces venosus 120613-1]|uniref:Uncharacterized protein n=1 Tax=Choiromyces venosus 120613-1 TaxID=1336337 RepID=A0A3N4JC27_9PEZI|nr:hypothetical protein L873DRAFT_1292028 [Choiromyces venosus 120613-1]